VSRSTLDGGSTSNRFDVLLEPLSDVLAMQTTAGEFEHQALLLIDGRINLKAVEDHEHLRRCMCDAFVAIDERVVERQRDEECCRFR
jgi:hypothetical protein